MKGEAKTSVAEPSTTDFSVYYMKGNDSRLLSKNQSKEIADFAKSRPLSDSFLIYNKAETHRKLKEWKTKLPWIRPHYAIKANSIQCIVQDMISGGAGMDCASRSEIEEALKHGLLPADIVYSHPIKDVASLKYAVSVGVSLTTADSVEELHKLKKHAPEMKVLWRIAIDEQAKEDEHMTCFSSKFGDSLETDQQIHSRMKEIQELGVILEGIHFHCGSAQHGATTFSSAVKLARRCMEIGRMHGHSMVIMDIGGGFPSHDIPTSTIDALQLTRDDPLGYKVIAQPGRHFSALSFILMVRVIGQKRKAGRSILYLNESVYHSLVGNITTYDNFLDPKQFYGHFDATENKHKELEALEVCTIFGMTCCGIDVIAKNMDFPTTIKTDDWLCMSGMGAYTHSFRSTFNGMRTTDTTLIWESKIEENPEQSNTTM